MPNTKAGAKKTHQSLREIYGDDFWKEIRKRRRDYSKAGFASDKVGEDGLTGKERAAKYGKKRKNNNDDSMQSM